MKKLLRVAVALGCLAPLLARAADADAHFLPTFELRKEWNATDTALQSGVVVLQVIDWRQTRWFLKNPPRCITTPGQGTTCTGQEQNPLLGPHPSIGHVDLLIGLSVVGHAAISYLLPAPLRTGWQVVFIGIEYSATRTNRNEGVPALGLREGERLASTEWQLHRLELTKSSVLLQAGRAF